MPEALLKCLGELPRYRLFRWTRHLLICVVAVKVYTFPLVMIPHGDACLPEIARGKTHDDWLWSLAWVSRGATTVCEQNPPKMVFGNQDYWFLSRTGGVGPKPIPRPGEWHCAVVTFTTPLWKVRLPYCAFRLHNEYHLRIGCRWDDLDGHFQWPSAALKWVEPEWDRLLWDTING